MRRTMILGVHDLFVAGLEDIEEIGGGCLRFTFFRERDGERETVEEISVVMHESAVPQVMRKTARKTKVCACSFYAMRALN